MSKHWTHLLIHHTVTAPTATVDDIRRMHKARGFADIGYHFLLARDAAGRGHLKPGRPDYKSGAHAGAPSETKDHQAWNSFALGLSVVGTFHPGLPNSERMTPQLYQDLVGAVVHLCRKYNIPPANIRYHRDVKQTACPGDWFPDKAKLITDVAQALG